MKLARCENGHLYPMDAYFDCPFCSGELDENEMDIIIPEPEHISEERPDDEETEYSIDEIGSDDAAYTDKVIYSGRKCKEMDFCSIESADIEGEKYRIIDKAEKEAIIKKASEDYIRTHDLHINSTKENTAVWLKEKTQSLRDAASVVSDIVEDVLDHFPDDH